MGSTQWYYPGTPEEALKEYGSGKALFHAGGTWIKPVQIERSEKIIDLSRAGLDYFKEEDHSLIFGAMLTYSQILDRMDNKYPRHIFYKAVKEAAATPLRNRITLGGSVYAFPLWSDIMGPLLACGAKITIQGKDRKTLGLEEYVKNPEYRSDYLIREIGIPNTGDPNYFWKEKKVKFDYAVFTLSLVKGKNGKIQCVATGNKSKYMILDSINQWISGSGKTDGKNLEEKLSGIDIPFARKAGYSAQYIENMVKVRIIKGLRELKIIQ